MKKLIIPLIILLLINITKVKSIYIPNKSIRIRVIANSDSNVDQEEKIKISIKIQKYIQTLLKDTNTVEEANKIISNNIDNINQEIKKYTNNYHVMYGKNFFPEKKYKGTIYKEGYYDSLVIKLGKGQGKNWWCVLFPPLCLMETEENIDEVEYRSIIRDIINKYF